MPKVSKLRQWRLANGYSQVKVAKLLLLSQGSIHAYETGAAHPEPVVADRIRYMTTRLGPFVVTESDLLAAWKSAHKITYPEAFVAGVQAERKQKSNGQETHPQS